MHRRRHTRVARADGGSGWFNAWSVHSAALQAPVGAPPEASGTATLPSQMRKPLPCSYLSGPSTDLMLAVRIGLPNVYRIVHMNQGSKSHVASGRWVCCECWSETQVQLLPCINAQVETPTLPTTCVLTSLARLLSESVDVAATLSIWKAIMRPDACAVLFASGLFRDRPCARHSATRFVACLTTGADLDRGQQLALACLAWTMRLR